MFQPMGGVRATPLSRAEADRVPTVERVPAASTSAAATSATVLRRGTGREGWPGADKGLLLGSENGAPYTG